MEGIRFLFLIWVVLAILSATFSSCTSDTIEPQEVAVCDTLNPSYAVQVRSIIDRSCAYSDCHIAGTGNGDFSFFAGILPNLENGQFSLRVLEIGDMPPFDAIENRKLSQEDRDVLECWMEAGFPEE